MGIDNLERSRDFLREGKIEKAQIILRRALDESPNHARVLELYGDLEAKLGRYEESIARYEHASENYTQNNQYAEAIICLEKITKMSKNDETIFFRLADLYRFFGMPNEAVRKIIEFCSWALENKDEGLFIAGLRKIVELQPKNLSLGLSFAKILLSINRIQEAHDELKRLKVIAEEVNDERILNEITKLSTQYDGGEELDPKSRVELGNLLYEIGSKDEAIIEFSKAASALIEEGKIEDALSVLNRMIEIDPGNAEALSKIKELKAKTEVKEAAPEIKERPPLVPKEKKIPEVETKEKIPIQEDINILQELSKEVEGFIITPEFKKEEARPAEIKPSAAKPDEIPPLEGQIADIEFLLKEAEAPSAPSFELSQQFDEFRNNITWESEDIKKKVELAKIAYNAELYETALTYIKDDKDDKQGWPLSLEIIGGSLVKLGHYSEAIKTIGPMILLEEIPESQKIELRYLLASAYEGSGDFENALREIEHIIAVNPNYRDAREIYELLGGKTVVERMEEQVVTRPLVKEESPPPFPITREIVEKPREEVYPEFVEKKGEEAYPIIIEEPLPREKAPPKQVVGETPEIEEKGENIAFL